MENMIPISDDQLTVLLRTLLDRVGFRKIQALGFHLQPRHFYSPLNDCDFLEANEDLWKRPQTPPAIDWRVEEQMAVVDELAPFLEELREVPRDPPPDCSAFGWNNNFWSNSDALYQFGLTRARSPRRYVEIGCGWSSLLLKRAIGLNEAQGVHADVTLIEPYPNQAVLRHLPADWTIHRQMLQRADLSIFDRLEAGDFLFYDGSHCAKMASDVNWFFFQVLPRLKPGVIIHLHDIFLPEDYPPTWVFERGQTWNEQYLLQAFLMHNTAYEILIASRFLFLNRQSDLERLFRGIQPAYGCSFWMRKVSA